MKFTTEHEAVAFVQTLLSDLPEQEAHILARNFVMFFDAGEPYEPTDWPNTYGQGSGETSIGGAGGFGFGAGPWAIREKELGDLKEIAIGFGLTILAHDRHPLEFAAMAMGALCMVWRLRQKGVALGPLQKGVLFALRRGDWDHNSLTLDKLVEATRAQGEEWTEADVSETLRELQAMTLNDGTVEPLVHCNADGRWSTDARGLWELPFGAG
jgi:hypothetical protein